MGKKDNEKAIENEIIEFLRSKGRHAESNQAGKVVFGRGVIKLHTKGTPDITACINGMYVGIEVKDGKKEVLKWWEQKDERSENQFIQAVMIVGAGGRWMIVGSFLDFVKSYYNILESQTSLEKL